LRRFPRWFSRWFLRWFTSTLTRPRSSLSRSPVPLFSCPPLSADGWPPRRATISIDPDLGIPLFSSSSFDDEFGSTPRFPCSARACSPLALGSASLHRPPSSWHRWPTPTSMSLRGRGRAADRPRRRGAHRSSVATPRPGCSSGWRAGRPRFRPQESPRKSPPALWAFSREFCGRFRGQASALTRPVRARHRAGRADVPPPALERLPTLL